MVICQHLEGPEQETSAMGVDFGISSPVSCAMGSRSYGVEVQSGGYRYQVEFTESPKERSQYWLRF